MSKKVLIAILGWEDRFVKGLENDYNIYKFDECILFCYEDYLSQTAKSLDFVREFCRINDIGLSMPSLFSDRAVDNWKVIEHVMKVICERDIEVLFDISTTPRETLWSILFFIKQSFNSISFIYHKPMSYSEEWLSREPENPRLLFKHSGLMSFDKPTLLFIITGFDTERIKQLVNFYEPKKIVLLIQEGEQFRNAERNNKGIISELMHSDIELVLSNSFDFDDSYQSIKQSLDKYLNEYNIVATSLGPKISGLSLYIYHNENPSIALCYVPSKEYNVEYSKGWGGAISGTLAFGPSSSSSS